MLEADLQLKLGDEASTLTALAAALAADPSSQEARDLLDGVIESPADTEGGAFDKAQQLLDAGFTTEAQVEAGRVITEGESPGRSPTSSKRADGQRGQCVRGSRGAVDGRLPHGGESGAQGVDRQSRIGDAREVPEDRMGAVLRAGAGVDRAARAARPRGAVAAPTRSPGPGRRRQPLAGEHAESVVGALMAEVAGSGTGRSLERVEDVQKPPDLQLGGVFTGQWSWIAGLLTLVLDPTARAGPTRAPVARGARRVADRHHPAPPSAHGRCHLVPRCGMRRRRWRSSSRLRLPGLGPGRRTRWPVRSAGPTATPACRWRSELAQLGGLPLRGDRR